MEDIAVVDLRADILVLGELRLMATRRDDDEKTIVFFRVIFLSDKIFEGIKTVKESLSRMTAVENVEWMGEGQFILKMKFSEQIRSPRGFTKAWADKIVLNVTISENQALKRAGLIR